MQYIQLISSAVYDVNDYDVKYITSNDNWAECFIEFCEHCEEYDINSNIPTIRNFFKFYEHQGYEVGAIIDFWEAEEYFDYNSEELSLNYKQCKREIMNYYRRQEDLQEFLEKMEDYINRDDLYIEYPQYLGYNAGTVGYSDWAYYITLGDIDYNFVQDLWEGWNFYDIAILNDKGEYVDGVNECYLPNNKDLIDCVECNFGINRDEIHLIKNECSRYLDFKQYEMIPASYDFIEVK